MFGIQYFLWYGQGIGASHWNSDPKYCQVTDRPLLGYYGSAKGETILYHFDLFEKMGFDYVILNLHVDQYGVNKLELAGIQHVFEIAKINKSRLKFVIQLALYVVDSVDEVIKTVDEIENYLFPILIICGLIISRCCFGFGLGIWMVMLF